MKNKIATYIIYLVSVPVLLVVALVGLGAFVGAGLYFTVRQENENIFEYILVCCVFEIAWLVLFFSINAT
jgi:hypothetical protein